MNRDAMYRFLQACLMGPSGYTTKDGVTFYRDEKDDAPFAALVLDAMIERYLMTKERLAQVSVAELAHSLDVRPEEVLRSMTALSNITLMSNHLEEKLVRVDHIDIDHQGKMSVTIKFNGWLAYHLNHLCETAGHLPASSNHTREVELIS